MAAFRLDDLAQPPYGAAAPELRDAAREQGAAQADSHSGKPAHPYLRLAANRGRFQRR